MSSCDAFECVVQMAQTAVPRLWLTAAATDTTYDEPCVVCTQTTSTTTAHVLLSEVVGLWSQVDHG